MHSIALLVANAVFKGSPAYRDAPVLDDISPLIILSHGGLRSTDNSGAWLSMLLAKSGFVVVEVNAHRSDRATDAVDQVWQRPDDVSGALLPHLGGVTKAYVIGREATSFAMQPSDLP